MCYVALAMTSASIVSAKIQRYHTKKLWGPLFTP
ncbi:hypothetical protein MUK42_37579 [Musa troglodytarum]|uniref:Uncharacterized protein n=1 Tax=Musa troglodytarum TaxID=320322 RepID=A0A9E7KSX9_9LILI|nr:hypothetical protein MUK42_36752 [Musa troglodytarum]URE33413.1 hypothetical protein MUK42_37579 [Musa troglodytarum]